MKMLSVADLASDRFSGGPQTVYSILRAGGISHSLQLHRKLEQLDTGKTYRGKA